jgi:predicted DsbA family dithiol-disulfide isomerase
MLKTTQPPFKMRAFGCAFFKPRCRDAMLVFGKPGATLGSRGGESTFRYSEILIAATINPSLESPRLVQGARKLDIVSDTICPWCYVGKRRLEVALPILLAGGLAFELRWRPFQLNPDMPKVGLDRRAYRSAKFGSWEKSLALDAQVAAAGAAEGLEFRHDRMLKTPNTVASHILVGLAYDIGGAALQGRVVEALFAGYFNQGRDVGDPQILADIGAEAGLDRASILSAITDPERTDSVVKDESLARKLHLNGVPSIVLDGRYLFSGARSVPAIVQALRDASALSTRSGLDSQ